jgi:hypothetical protein
MTVLRRCACSQLDRIWCNLGGGNPVAKVTGISARIPGGREVASVGTTLTLAPFSMKLSKQTGPRGGWPNRPNAMQRAFISAYLMGSDSGVRHKQLPLAPERVSTQTTSTDNEDVESCG